MESVTIQLSRHDVARLDELRAERNLTRGQLVAELLDTLEPGPAATDEPATNPWAHAWPSAKG
jgi:hypothetical protein